MIIEIPCSGCALVDAVPEGRAGAQVDRRTHSRRIQVHSTTQILRARQGTLSLSIQQQLDFLI